MKLKDLKKAAVYLTPVFPKIETKRYKFTILKILNYIFLYSLILSIVIISVLTFTPARKLVYFIEYEKINKESERIKLLENHVQFLTGELESLYSTNKKLKYSYLLGTNDSLDTSAAVYDSLQKKDEIKLKIGGNILDPFLKLFMPLEQDTINERVSFLRPSEGFIIKHYNPDEGHLGIDFAVKENTPVYASAGGIVVFADYTVSDGFMIIINHDHEFVTVYKHCSGLIKKSRDVVQQGELIARSGNSGKNTTGPHLHFEIWKEGKTIDPEKFLINI